MVNRQTNVAYPYIKDIIMKKKEEFILAIRVMKHKNLMLVKEAARYKVTCCVIPNMKYPEESNPFSDKKSRLMLSKGWEEKMRVTAQ